MPSATATVDFHKKVRQNAMNPGRGHAHDHDNDITADINGTSDPERQATNESTPLLSGGFLQNGGASRRDQAYHLFLDRKHTPGVDSANPFVKWPAHVWHVTKITLLSSYVNFLLVFVPVGIAAGALGWPSTWVFSLNFLAIIPLAAVLSFATEEISARLGETLGGLLNATFGNAVELIVSFSVSTGRAVVR
jgi:hypothetical protein